MISKEELIAFEQEIANLFNDKKIRSVIHLYSGGEDELIEIFKDVRKEDWVLGSWRSHYECLLKGVPRDILKRRIIDGYSIALCFPEYKIISSGIFGGVLPIAVGLAMSIKRKGENSIVHVFSGDMTAESGIFHECLKYSQGHNLPIKFYIADNGLSVCTNTKDVWGITQADMKNVHNNPFVEYFSYKPGRFPHAGSGVRVPF